jgi:hypothetical protein
MTRVSPKQIFQISPSFGRGDLYFENRACWPAKMWMRGKNYLTLAVNAENIYLVNFLPLSLLLCPCPFYPLSPSMKTVQHLSNTTFLKYSTLIFVSNF